ncbi:MAG: DUF2231 domain-containing protein [Bdellovibrionales bacterium]|nr:DUF2231 domain-containing protein [Bdellovibrionales bacterium]
MNAAHIHLLVNHLPIFSMPVALVFVLFSLRRNNRPFLNFSLWVLFVCTLTTVGAYFSGENAEHMVEKLEFVRKTMIHTHEDAGVISLWLAGVTSALTLVAIFLRSSVKKIVFVQISIAASLITVASLAYTGYLGGKIHHPEIDIKPLPQEAIQGDLK